MTHIRRVAVLGFGTMGTGIAQVAAQAGFEIVVLEADEQRLQAGRERMSEFLSGGVQRGKLSEQERAAILGRVRGTTDVAELVDVDLVIEAVVEDLEVKRELLPRVAAVVGEQSIIATNTSALSVTAIASTVPRPDRVLGLHFFNPAPLMKLVEVIAGEQTSQDTLEATESFATAIGKEHIRTKDRPGFLVNLLLMPYLNQVAQAYDDGIASARDIDRSVELGLGYPMGGLALLDLIGIDNHVHATAAAYEETKAPRFAPPPILTRMVDAGHLGHKSGRGFRVGVEEEDE
jgi:3-hydroxybutyryl-CoA dehydrogenase